MGQRLPIFLPRIAVLALAALGLSAGLTFAAGKQIQASTPAAAPTQQRKAETVVVPDLRNQAFVFAKGLLEDKILKHVMMDVMGTSFDDVRPDESILEVN